MEEPGRLQSMASLRVRHDWATSLSLFTFMHWKKKWQPTPVFLPGESQGRRSLMGCRHGVAQSRTRMKRLSSSSNRGWTVLLCIPIPMCSTLTLYTKRKLHQYFLTGKDWVLFSSLPLSLFFSLSLFPSHPLKTVSPQKSSLSSSSYHACGVPLREQAPLQLFSLALGLSLKPR